MTAVDWWVLVVWLSVAVVLVWPAYGTCLRFLRSEAWGESLPGVSNGDDVWFAGLLGVLAALLWPVIVSMFLAMSMSKRIWTGSWLAVHIHDEEKPCAACGHPASAHDPGSAHYCWVRDLGASDAGLCSCPGYQERTG